jgi:hypothetical protein
VNRFKRGIGANADQRERRSVGGDGDAAPIAVEDQEPGRVAFLSDRNRDANR